jgi:GT2 family glycosyltransferase
MTVPEVSVVVPTFRRPDRLARIVGALAAQTLDRDRFEVVIVDNQSGDATADVLAALASTSSINLRPLSTPDRHGRAAAARNMGWRAARAPVVAFTDDDCVPEPTWLEAGLRALADAPGVGVVQGVTKRPDGPTTDWTVYREILAPTPWFEACNLFYRRSALDQTGGFDEDYAVGGEDTMAGWAVLDAGWQRAFADDAIVWHDNEERGVSFHIRYAWTVERRIPAIARRYPEFRRTLWKPWAIRPLNVAYCTAVVGGVLGLVWKRPFLLAVLPYAWMRRPPRGHHRYVQLAAERFAVDTAGFASLKIGAVKERTLIL